MEVADAELLAKDINEGDWVFFDKDNKIFKEEQFIYGEAMVCGFYLQYCHQYLQH